VIRPESPVDLEPPRVAHHDDADLVTRILVDAFHDDPMWGAWAFPDPGTRRQHRETLFRVLVEGAMRYPHVWLTAGGTATSLWIPPGGTELSAAQEETIDALLREALGARAGAVLRAFELFAEARPAQPHFYLTLLGTDPQHSGRGLGQALLRSNLDRVDAAGRPAYLEAADELVPMYQRFGFRVLERFDLDAGPTVNCMWRKPRPVHETVAGD
jgi:ribosomal protein S18 acetylase RimI-like enzyme